MSTELASKLTPIKISSDIATCCKRNTTKSMLSNGKITTFLKTIGKTYSLLVTPSLKFNTGSNKI